MLRVAVPNKGVLSEPAAAMLAESGYRQRRTTSELAVYDPENDTEFFYLRPRDIAIYVAAGTLDVGITGRDMLLETAPADGEGAAAAEVMPLGFGRSSFRFASPADSPVDAVAKLEGKRIATAYPGLLQRFLDESGMKAAVVKLDGAVETACRLGVADAVCDVVETGTTLRAAGLRIIGEPVLASEAVLVRRAGAEEIPAVAQLRRRLQGVLVARRYVMLDYDCP
ncbi:MAG: hisG, partial [Modestobacter sp.]|nr:hisG [Modestobacter sp.]